MSLIRKTFGLPGDGVFLAAVYPPPAGDFLCPFNPIDLRPS